LGGISQRHIRCAFWPNGLEVPQVLARTHPPRSVFAPAIAIATGQFCGSCLQRASCARAIWQRPGTVTSLRRGRERSFDGRPPEPQCRAGEAVTQYLSPSARGFSTGLPGQEERAWGTERTVGPLASCRPGSCRRCSTAPRRPISPYDARARATLFLGREGAVGTQSNGTTPASLHPR
jgi:hypothetical protein